MTVSMVVLGLIISPVATAMISSQAVMEAIAESGDVGEDTLTGGAGNDHFVLALNRDSSTSVSSLTSFESTPTDMITDFTDGQDVIELTGGLSFQQLNIVSIGSSPKVSRLDSTLIMSAITQEWLAILTGVRASQITASDFISNSI
jgi:Ca2+-binding RTX toxin-like protein